LGGKSRIVILKNSEDIYNGVYSEQGTLYKQVGAYKQYLYKHYIHIPINTYFPDNYKSLTRENFMASIITLYNDHKKEGLEFPNPCLILPIIKEIVNGDLRAENERIANVIDSYDANTGVLNIIDFVGTKTLSGSTTHSATYQCVQLLTLTAILNKVEYSNISD
jgi:hypothetical protein